jgi:hypothetical protein
MEFDEQVDAALAAGCLRDPWVSMIQPGIVRSSAGVLALNGQPLTAETALNQARLDRAARRSI